MSWQPGNSISPHPRETREAPRLTGPGWSRDGGTRMRCPGERELRSLERLTVWEAPGQAWDNLTSSKSCPLHTCSVRSAQHPAPPASTAPVSSALLYFFFFLFIHGFYHLLNMPLFKKYTMLIVDCVCPPGSSPQHRL